MNGKNESEVNVLRAELERANKLIGKYKILLDLCGCRGLEAQRGAVAALSPSAEPSAPVWDGKSWDVIYQREGKTVLSIRTDGVMDAYDRDGLMALMVDLASRPLIQEPSAPVEIDERAEIKLDQVLRAYEYAEGHPHRYLRGTTNWCAAVAHSLNEQARAALAHKP